MSNDPRDKLRAAMNHRRSDLDPDYVAAGPAGVAVSAVPPMPLTPSVAVL
jgi:hypothetical protein